MNLVEHSSAPLQFYATPPHRCSYLPDREAINAFADPRASMNMSLYAKLLDRGFRRSGKHVYRPYCDGCSACVATRVPVMNFQPNRSQQRNWTRNFDLVVDIGDAQFREEEFALYRKYVNTRHAGGEMENPSVDAYRSFLIAPWADTLFVSFRTGNRLVCVAVVDRLPGSLSAVYTFFDPDEYRRGLGTFAVQWQLSLARARRLDYVYLGYWIADHPKMGYKNRFKPTEGLINSQWVLLR